MDEDESPDIKEKHKEVNRQSLTLVKSSGSKKKTSNKERYNYSLKKHDVVKDSDNEDLNNIQKMDQDEGPATSRKYISMKEEQHWSSNHNDNVINDDGADSFPKIESSYSISDETFSHYSNSEDKIDRSVSLKTEQPVIGGKDAVSERRNSNIASSSKSLDLNRIQSVVGTKKNKNGVTETISSNHLILHRENLPQSEDGVGALEIRKRSNRKNRFKHNSSDTVSLGAPNNQLQSSNESKEIDLVTLTTTDDSDFSEASPVTPIKSARKIKRTRKFGEDEDSEDRVLLNNGKKKRAKHVLESDDSSNHSCHSSRNGESLSQSESGPNFSVKKKRKIQRFDRIGSDASNETSQPTEITEKFCPPVKTFTADSDSSDLELSPLTPSKFAKKKKRTREFDGDEDSEDSSLMTNSKKKRSKHVIDSDDSDTSEDSIPLSQLKILGINEGIKDLNKTEKEENVSKEDYLSSRDDLHGTNDEIPVTVNCKHSQTAGPCRRSSSLDDESFPFKALTRKSILSTAEKLPSIKGVSEKVQCQIEQAVGASKFFDDTLWSHSLKGKNKTATLEKQLRYQLFPDDDYSQSKVSKENNEEVIDTTADDWLNDTEAEIYWSQEYNMVTSSVWQSIEEDLQANQGGKPVPIFQKKSLEENVDLQVKRKDYVSNTLDKSGVSPCEAIKESPLYGEVITECDMEGFSGSNEVSVTSESIR